jgi:uncharacterized protein
MNAHEKRINDPFPVRSIGGMVKDVDLSKRTVTGLYNSYNVIDSYGDVLVMGSASKSIQERGPKSNATAKIKHALMHDLERLPGKIEVLEERNLGNVSGLYFETRMANTTLGNDTLINYQEGIYDNHSIGFNYVPYKIKHLTENHQEWQSTVDGLINPNDVQKDIYIVSEIMLWEGSTVSFGANQLTPFLGIKSNDMNLIKMKLNDRLERLVKQLRKGTQSDEMMKTFELQVLQLKQMISELTEPEDKTTLIEPVKVKESTQINAIELINNFKF